MRLTPRRPSRVVWEEGMYLAPQHFQAQRRHFEDTVAHTIEAVFPFAYGLTSVALDSEALASGTLMLEHARGILPDGSVVSVPESDPLPPPVSLSDRFSPDRDAHLVSLALPPWSDEGANVRVSGVSAPGSGEGGNGHRAGDVASDPRFVESVARMRDETTGEDATEIRFAAKQLRLVLDTELGASDVSLPVALVRRDGAGRYVVDADYIPPVLKLGASGRLLGLLHDVIGMLEAKGAALAASLNPATETDAGTAPAAYVGNELATRWLLHAVRSAESPLRHLLSTRRAHPERLWLELSRLAGALCTFSLTTHARDLPVYTHDDLASCFGALERHLREHLDLVIAAHAVVVALERASDVLYVGRMDDPRCYEPGARWFLGIRSSIGTAETLDLAPQLLKVCAQKFVLELVRRAYRGLEIEHLPSPPPGLAPRAGLAYFEIAMAGPCAQGLRDTREVGVYVPDAFPDAVLEIAVLVPT